MTPISTSFQKIEFPCNSLENPRCSNCWEQGSIFEPLFDIHSNRKEQHLICQDCTTSWIRAEDLSIKKIFQCHICQTPVHVDEAVITALGIGLGDEESFADGYMVVAGAVNHVSEQVLHSNRLEEPYIPPKSIASILAEFGLSFENENEWAIFEADALETPAEAPSSASAGTAVTEWKPSKVSFSPDCKDVRLGKEWRDITEANLNAKTDETFETLSNPYPGHEEIAKLMQVELSVDLWIKYWPTRYQKNQNRYLIDMQSLLHIEYAFYDAINEAVDEVIQTKRIEIAIPYLYQRVVAILEKWLIPDEEATFPTNLRDKAEVLDLCKPIISEILQKPTACKVLETFFIQNLEEELCRKR